jgi:hypothetical protein
MTAPLPLFAKKPRAYRLRKPPPPLEFHTHCVVADELRKFCRPDWRFTHIGHGEKRSLSTGKRLKRMGVQPGWPDFLLVAPGGLAHFLELKRPGAKPSEAQAEFAKWCRTYGVPYALAYGVDEAFSALKSWGCLRINIGVA